MPTCHICWPASSCPSFPPTATGWTGNTDRAFFEEVELLTIVDQAARTNALVSGVVDAIDRIDLNTVDMVSRYGNIEVIETSGGTHYTLPMNATMAPFDNLDVRLALKYAIDRQAILDTILSGYGASIFRSRGRRKSSCRCRSGHARISRVFESPCRRRQACRRWSGTAATVFTAAVAAAARSGLFAIRAAPTERRNTAGARCRVLLRRRRYFKAECQAADCVTNLVYR